MSSPPSPRPPESAPAQDAALETTGSSVLRGGLWNGASRVVPQAYTLVLSVVAARFLGPEGLGRQSFIAFVVLSVTSLLSGGLSVALQRFVGDTLGAGQGARVRGLARWSWRVQIGFGVLGAIGLASVGFAGSTPRDAWLLAAITCLAAVSQTVPNAVLTGAQRWRSASIVGLVTGGIAVPTIIVVLARGGGITGIFAVEAVVAIANLVWTGVLARRLLRTISSDTEPPGDLTRKARVFALQTTLGTVISLIVFTRSEFFFLARSADDAEIAVYSIAFAAQAALVLIPTAVAGVMLPAFATLFGAGDVRRLTGGYARALRLITLLALPLCTVSIAFVPAAIRVVYGSDYNATEPVVRIMLSVVPLIPLSAAAGGLLFAVGRVRSTLVIGAAAAVVNLVLDVVLISRYAAEGAAIANASAQAFAAAATLLWTGRVLGGAQWPSGALLRIGFLAAGIGAAGLAVDIALGSIATLALGIPAVLIVLVALLRLLRPIPAEDAEWLRSAVDGTLGRIVAVVCAIGAPPVTASTRAD